MLRKSTFILLTVIMLLSINSTPVTAGEFSIISESTILGRNYGYPTGTLNQGPTLVGETDLVLETAFYFKTLEIFSLDFMEGETFVGYRVPTRLRYRPNTDLTVELGAYLGHELGDDNSLNIVAPIVRLVYEPSDEVFIIGGTLLPTHWMHETLLDDVQKLRVEVEQGFQLRINRQHVKHDTWINWRIREGSYRAEEFEIGLTNQFRLINDIFWFDTQFMWAHAGGQLSESPRVEQSLIYAAGLSAGVYGTRLSFDYFYSRDETDLSPLVKGTGYAVSLTADIKPADHILLRPFGEVFRGDDFSPERGDPLYQLDKYSQLGINALFTLADELQIEAGFVKQYTGDVDNLTYQLSFVWGQAFTNNWLHRRP